MGAGFCNFNLLGWNTQTPIAPSSLQAQHTLNSRKVGREDEGVSSTRPELVTLPEYLEDHGDDVILIYLTDNEAILQTIHRWIGCGAKLNFSEVKAHRGDPLNEEADIRAEVGRRKEDKEVGWKNPTNRTIYRWKVGQHTKSTTWTNTVRNRFHQKEGEIEHFEY
jgi:hypothetical protein